MKQIGQWIKSFFTKLILFLVLGASLQLPHFIETYELQLQGRINELSWQINNIERLALEAQIPIQEYIQTLSANEDEKVSKLGQNLSATLSRYDRFKKAKDAIHDAAAWRRLLLFLFYYDHELAVDSYQDFEWGLSLTMESLVMVPVGFLLGAGVYAILAIFLSALASFFLGPFRKKKKLELPEQ